MITRESSVPIEKSTTLIPKTTIISSYCTSAESSTENSITLVLIEITGATGAILVFANIFLYIFDHRERKKITSTNQNCLRNDMILWWFFLTKFELIETSTWVSEVYIVLILSLDQYFFFNSICVEIKFKPFSVAPKDNVTIIDMFTTGENHAELNFHEKVIFKGKPSIHPFLFSCLYFSS